MSSTGAFRYTGKPARARTDDLWRLSDPFDLHSPRGSGGSHRARRVGTTLFWAAVASLIAARVVMFDPAATRPVGGFVQANAAALTH